MASGLPRVLPDTNVCYPISVLDLVLRCDEHDLHRVVWTDDLLEELVKVWVRNGARTEAAARSIADQIGLVFAHQRVPRASYEHLVADMPGGDPDDYVHAAAAVAMAPSILLTANIEDFPTDDLGDLGVTVRHPDDYFVDLLDAEPEAILDVLGRMSRDRQRPPMTVEAIVGALKRAGLSRFAKMLRDQ